MFEKPSQGAGLGRASPTVLSPRLVLDKYRALIDSTRGLNVNGPWAARTWLRNLENEPDVRFVAIFSRCHLVGPEDIFSIYVSFSQGEELLVLLYSNCPLIGLQTHLTASDCSSGRPLLPPYLYTLLFQFRGHHTEGFKQHGFMQEIPPTPKVLSVAELVVR